MRYMQLIGNYHCSMLLIPPDYSQQSRKNSGGKQQAPPSETSSIAFLDSFGQKSLEDFINTLHLFFIEV